MKRLVRVTAVGYFEMSEDDLKDAFQADTFEGALDNQRQWYKDDPGVPFQEYVSFEHPVDYTFDLMPEGFVPEARED